MTALSNNSCQDYLLRSDSSQANFISCSNTNYGCTFKAMGRDLAGHELKCPYAQKSPQSSLTSITLSSTSSVFQTDLAGVSHNGSQEISNMNSSATFSKLQDNFYQNNSFYTPLNHMDNMGKNFVFHYRIIMPSLCFFKNN